MYGWCRNCWHGRAATSDPDRYGVGGAGAGEGAGAVTGGGAAGICCAGFAESPGGGVALADAARAPAPAIITSFHALVMHNTLKDLA